MLFAAVTFFAAWIATSRDRDLELRGRLMQRQYELRMVFLARIGLLKYRLQLPGFELPAPLRSAQKEFDERQAKELEGIADRVAGKERNAVSAATASYEALEKAARECCSDQPADAFGAQMKSFLALSARAEGLVRSLEQET